MATVCPQGVWSEHRVTWPLCVHRGCGQNIGLHGHCVFIGGVVRTQGYMATVCSQGVWSEHRFTWSSLLGGG